MTCQNSLEKGAFLGRMMICFSNMTCFVPASSHLQRDTLNHEREAPSSLIIRAFRLYSLIQLFFRRYLFLCPLLLSSPTRTLRPTHSKHSIASTWVTLCECLLSTLRQSPCLPQDKSELSTIFQRLLFHPFVLLSCAHQPLGTQRSYSTQGHRQLDLLLGSMRKQPCVLST